MRDQIVELIRKKPKHFSKIVNNSADMLIWVKNNTRVSTENMSEMIYSALYDESTICKSGNSKKFKSITEGYGFCGPARDCGCARESVSNKVAQSKAKLSDEHKQEIDK